MLTKRALSFLVWLVVISASLTAILWPGVCLGQVDNPATPNLDESLSGHHSDIYVTSSWGPTYSETHDCGPDYHGWGMDRWILEITQSQDLTVRVKDCCCPGDFYEIYVNGCLIGTTPQVPDWGCEPSPPNPSMSDGSFTVSLQAGTYTIEIRDAGFDGHLPEEIEEQTMCPAGYWVTGTLGAYTGMPWPCIPTISMVSPNSGIQGQTLSVTITGTNLSGTTSVSFGSDITVNNFSIDSLTHMTASISIDAGATPGTRDVSLTTPGGTATKTDAFTVIHAPCTITASADAHGSISPSGTVTVNYGADQTFTITPDTDYHIDTLTVDGSPVTPVSSYTFIDVTSNHTIHATFIHGTLTINASAGSHGSIDPSGAVTINYGEDQTFAITPDSGYHIDTLTVDGSPITPVSSYTFSNVTANHTISATFAITTFTITASAGAHGSISPSGAVTVNYGGEQTFTITPDNNYLIDSLMVDGSPVTPASSYTFSNVTASHTITATFALIPPTVTSVDPNAGVHLQTLNVIITGTYFTGATSVSFGSGITVNVFTVDSATRITVNITISGSAPIGANDVSVTTPAGTSTETDKFSVNLTQIPSVISSLSPNQGLQGQSLSVTIIGTYLSDTSSVSFGPGITVNDFTVDSLTQITASISISSSATTGARDVSVTTPAGTSTLSDGFTVMGAPPSAPTLVSPAQGAYVTGTAIIFQWAFHPDATKYWLEVNTDANWNLGTRLYYGYGSSTSQIVTGFPNNGTTYYWRVWAGNDYGWSTPSNRHFINGNAPAPPPAPNLVSPTLGAITGGTTIKFTWQASTGATTYWLEVNSDPNWGSDTRLFYALADGTSQLVGGFPNPSDTGTTFYWRVMAGNDNGLSAPSSSYFINIGLPPPNAPVLLSPANGAAIVGSSITFQWQASAGATYYWLEVNPDPNWSSTTRKFYNSVSTTSQVVDGFTQDGTTYFWRVWAGNAQGLGNPSGRSFFMTPIPAAPTLIYPNQGATIIQPVSIIFTWTSSLQATKYLLEVNSDPNWGSATRLFYGEVSGTSKTVTGFTLGTTYYWRVSAGNTAGWSPPSASQSFTVATMPAPTLVSPDNGANVPGASITLVWDSVAEVTTYWLEVNTDPAWGSTTRFYYNYGDLATSSKTVTGFANIGTTYYWRVWAANAMGWSAPSSGWSVINGTQASQTVTLLSPNNGANVAGSSITFVWSSLIGATSYWLEVNTDSNWGTGTRFYYGYGDLATASKTVTGFPSIGTTYYWRVWACKAAVWSTPTSGWSVINGTQGGGIPATPTLTSPTDGATVAGSSITFEWSAPSGATMYYLEVNTDPAWGSGTRFYYGYGDAATHSKTVTGFPSIGTTYYWRVWAANAMGWSAPTSGWSVKNGTIAIPATPTLTSPTNGANVEGTFINFAWTAPVGATKYWLEVNTDPAWGSGTRFYYSNVQGNGNTVTGFPNSGTTYYWRVWAGNANGWSAPTSGWSVINGTQGGGIPATPTLSSPTNGANIAATSITFEWSYPAGATKFWLEVNTDPAWGSGTRFYYAGMSATAQTVTGFPNNGTTYYWRVWAGNAIGWSAPTSGWSVINGTSSAPATPTLTSPDNGANIASTSITFVWSASAGATNYWLEVNTNPTWGSATRFYYGYGDAATHSKTITGFPNNGTTYYWRVWACNAAGWSTPTSGWSVINGFSAPPATPVLFSPGNGASVAGSSITFEWSAPAGATMYWLEVNTDPAWGSGTRFYYGYGDAATHSKTITGFPNNGTTYYWRVWACNAAGWSTATLGWSVHNP